MPVVRQEYRQFKEQERSSFSAATAIGAIWYPGINPPVNYAPNAGGSWWKSLPPTNPNERMPEPAVQNIEMRSTVQIDVIGGGLAGCEAAYAVADRALRSFGRCGLTSKRFIRAGIWPVVCSNSGNRTTGHRPGFARMEMRILGSLLLDCAGSGQGSASSAWRDRVSSADW